MRISLLIADKSFLWWSTSNYDEVCNMLGMHSYLIDEVVEMFTVVFTQDVTRIVKQIDKHGQVADMLAQHMRCMQSYYHKNYVDSYNALEKSAKYPECLHIWN